MPLGARDILMTVRAKDEASRILTSISGAFGTLGKGIDSADKTAMKQAASAKEAAKQSMAMGGALLGVGAVIAGVGAAGLAFYADQTKAAVDYNKEASLTLTQVRETGVGLEQIKDIGKNVGRDIAVPFQSLQKELYDIFSSTDLSAKDAEKALTQFSKAAVAGNVDVSKAGSATISILNGFQLPISQLNRVMDVQFKTVQIGRVNYDELASTIGRAIPSAQKAGQSVESLGGMLAFMTRNGMSAAMASTSAARAFDLISNPIFEANMKKIGLSTLDASGNFKDMTDIVDSLKTKMQGMNEGDKAKFLKDLTFGAGGTIQAMRFLNEATNDNSGALRSFTDQVSNSAGAMDGAYKIMADTPAAKLQLLKNNWQILRTEIGDAVIPVLNKVVEAVTPFIKAFNNLNPGMKQAIVYCGLIGSTLAVLIGVLIAVAGAIMLIDGALAVMEIELLPLTIIVFAITAAFVGLVAGIYLLITHFDWVKKQGVEAINALKAAWDAFMGGFENPDAKIGKSVDGVTKFFLRLGQVVRPVADVVTGLWHMAQEAFYSFQVGFNTGMPDILSNVDGLSHSFEKIGAVVSGIRDTFNTAWQDALRAYYSFQIGLATGNGQIMSSMVSIELVFETFGAAVKFIGDTATAVFTFLGQIILTLWTSFFGPVFGMIANIIMNVVVPAVVFIGELFVKNVEIIVTVVTVLGTVIGTVLYMIVNIIWVVLKPAIEFLWPIFKSQFDRIAAGAKLFWNDGVMPIFNALKGLWEDVMNAVADRAKNAWDKTKTIVKAGVNDLIDLINGLINSTGKGLNGIIGAYNKIPGVSHVDDVNLPNIPKLHTGGMVDSAFALNSKEVLRVLTQGEGVLNQNAVASLGGSAGVDALNNGTMPRNGGQSVVIQSGAVQITVMGGDGDVAQQVEDAVINALRKLTNQVKASS